MEINKKIRTPRTKEQWDMYFKGIKETELNMINQYPETAGSMAWAFSLLKVEAAFAYSKWAMKKASRGLK